MKIRWYGHSAFRITTTDGVCIIIDPYESGAFGGSISYGPIEDRADIVLVSHDHGDHNYTDGIKGPYTDVRNEGFYDIRGVKITAIPTFHDAFNGRERGQNLVFVIEVPADGLKVVHLGDLGHPLDQDAVDRIGKTDVLLLPVGGFFTIDAEAASRVMNDIKPLMTIPMHFKTEKVEFPIAGVDEFIRGKERVTRLTGSEIAVTKARLPKEPEIFVLQYAK
jgi:L-ascorbate metabolism protein UlaG (beta-lactamase superfamily)